MAERDMLGRVPAPVLLAAGIISVQVGAGFAARLFGAVSAAGLTGLRLWAAGLLMAVLGARPAFRAVAGLVATRAWRDGAVIGGFGLTLAIMNFSIYQSFARIPLGIAVTIEFLGPLGVAVASSRRLIDLLWVALAAVGVGLLGTVGISAATFNGVRHPGSVAIGVVYALVSAASWASYILLSRSTGRRFSGSSGLVIAMCIAAVIVTPAAVAGAGSVLLRPSVLAAGLAIGLLSSVIPYRFELETLRRVPAQVFGIWMSLEPAVAALVGVVMLRQALSAAQWLAICCVMAATAGAALGAASSVSEPQSVVVSQYDRSVSAQPVSQPARVSWSRRFRSWADVLINPTPLVMRRLAFAGVITSALIIWTGGAVRLSESGLGCTTWPKCTSASLVAAGATGDPLIHRWVEFGNRVATVLIFVVAVAVFVAAWQFRDSGAGEGRRRRDLVWLAAAQPAGIAAQALIGGIVVLTKLAPFWVSLHFIATVPVLAAAVALHVRCTEGTGHARRLVQPLVLLVARALVVVTAAMMLAGTLVTGAGPLAGAANVQRYRFMSLTAVTQLHADIGWVLGTVAVMLVLSLHLTQAPARAVRLGWIVLGLIAAQGAIGYAQYFSGLPAGLVWVHVANTALIWIAVLRLNFSLRDRSVVAPREVTTEGALR